MSNNNEPKPTGNPAVDKLMSSIDSKEKSLGRSAAFRAATEQFNTGNPVPPVNALLGLGCLRFKIGIIAFIPYRDRAVCRIFRSAARLG